MSIDTIGGVNNIVDMPCYEDWIRPKELAVIENREDELSREETPVYRKRAKCKVNGNFVQIFELFPKLVRFMDSERREDVRYSTDPFSIGLALGELYDEEQRIDLIAALILVSELERETSDTMLDRASDKTNKIMELVDEESDTLQSARDISRVYTVFQQTLFERISKHINDKRESRSTEIAVPTTRLIEWVISQNPDDFERTPNLPYLLHTAYTTSESETFIHRFEKHCLNLRTTAIQLELQDPLKDNWEFNWHNPTQRDYSRNEMVIREMDPEIEDIVDMFWRVEQIEQVNQLFVEGIEACGELSQRDRTILEDMFDSDGEEHWKSNRDPGWTRYDTRRANLLVNKRNPPLLLREDISKSGTVEKRYQPTNFGRLIYWIDTHIEENRDGETSHRFLSTIPDVVIEAALDSPTEEIHS